MKTHQETTHPGSIVYIDGDTSEVVAERKACDVPEHMRFVQAKEGAVPVVRVISSTLGDRRTIREFGPNGELLRSTVQLRENGEASSSR